MHTRMIYNNNNTSDSTIYFLILHRLEMLQQKLNFLSIIAVFSHECTLFVSLCVRWTECDRCKNILESKNENFLRALVDRYTSEKPLEAVNSLKGCHCVFSMNVLLFVRIYKVLKNESETDERYI